MPLNYENKLSPKKLIPSMTFFYETALSDLQMKATEQYFKLHLFRSTLT